jgi:hypothetical protein
MARAFHFAPKSFVRTAAGLFDLTARFVEQRLKLGGMSEHAFQVVTATSAFVGHASIVAAALPGVYSSSKPPIS